MTALETFLRALRETKASDQATPENSYLPHLKPLLEAALEGVTPKLTVLTHPKKVSGAGLADSGLVESGSNDASTIISIQKSQTLNSSNVIPAAWRTVTNSMRRKFAPNS